MSADARRHFNPHDADRRGIGALVGQVDLSGDWDSADINDQIANEFGIPS
jgi:hypothetical protein